MLDWNPRGLSMGAGDAAYIAALSDYLGTVYDGPARRLRVQAETGVISYRFALAALARYMRLSRASVSLSVAGVSTQKEHPFSDADYADYWRERRELPYA